MFVALLVVLASCQAVGGFDVNKALVEAVVAKSMEGKGEFALHLEMDEKAQMAPEQRAMLKVFEKMTVSLESIKMESSARMSVKGTASIASYTIPFEAGVTEEQIVLKVDGGKKPIVFNLKDPSASTEMEPFLTELQKKLSDGELSRGIMSYFIKQLPNPSKINVENVSELIHGETVPLHKLHSEITGKELLPLVKAFVKNVLKDDESLKELIGQLYDALYPIIAAELEKAIKSVPEEVEGMDEEGMDEEEMDLYYVDELTPYNSSPIGQVKTVMQPIVTGIKAVLDDRDIAIEVIHTEVKQLFVIALVALESTGKETQKALDTVFNQDSWFKTDLYFDNSFKLRKSDTSLKIAVPPQENSGGIASVGITMSMENWNVNGNVKADSIPMQGGAFTFDKGMKPADLLQNFDPNSAVYQLLKKDLGIAKISLPLFLGTGEYVPNRQQPFIERGVTMVPTRFIAERLNAKVEWNSTDQTITVTDPLASRTIVLRGGSNIAIVDGKSTEMEVEVLIRDDNSFVPLTFIVNQLGGKTSWNEAMRTVIITKD